MPVGVLDAGVVIGWLVGGHRSQPAIHKLFKRSAAGELELHLSVVNVPEVYRHTRRVLEPKGIDPLAMLEAARVQIHLPDSAIARRVARLRCSLADGFAAATAEAMSARLHTADAELIEQLEGSGIAITKY